ncbi:MAG: SpaA isopeptide-forming pilin-related protein [Gudongella sp.]|nr:SpaA isopeptide-forming pilin-related protein [Gudongella sp.]
MGQIGISKKNVIITFIIFIILTLVFPFLSEAIGDEEILKLDSPLETDDWYAKVRVAKTVKDIQNSEPKLEGFEFSLYSLSDKEETFLESKMTNIEGILEFDKLSEGDYRLYETKLDNYTSDIGDQGIKLSIDREENSDGMVIIDVLNTKLYQEEILNEDLDEIMGDEVEIEDEDEWEIVIIDEPLPVAVPDFPQTESVVPLIEILPIAVLPRTGELNSIAQSGIGVIMVCLGVYINRKKDE